MPSGSTAEQVGRFTGRGEGGDVTGAAYDVGDEIRRIRQGFEEHLRIFHGRMQLLSDEEARSQLEFVERILHNPEGNREQLQTLLEDYASAEARDRRSSTMELYDEGLRKLADARSANVISRESYDEWIREWFQNRHLPAFEKTNSLRGSLMKYLAERWELARERAKYLRDPPLDAVDPKLRSELRFLRDDREWFETHTFEQRKNLLGRVAAAFKAAEGGPEYQKLYDKAEKMLLDAIKTPQPALHRDKVGAWLKRIFESGATPAQIHAFLTGKGQVQGKSLPELIEIWRAIAVQFWTLRKDPAFQGVKTQFINTKAFLWLHYDERVAYVNTMRVQAEKARALRARATQHIAGAAQAEALDAEGKQRWLTQYVFNGRYTLEELESIVSGNLTERLDRKIAVVQRFERVSDEARKVKGIRGMPLPEKSAFLKLHYEKQLAMVLEMEMRLGQIRRQRPHLLLIRHFMDRGEWESSLELIEEARQNPGLSFDDDRQLTSMERYITLHRWETSGKHEGVKETLSEAQQIDRLINEISSPSLEYLCVLLCDRGSESIGALAWTSYNRDWCNKHGYLNPEREYQAIRKGKAEALAKARRRKRGVVHETIQGETGKEEFIELSRSSATNVCVDIVDSGAMNAFAHTLHERRKDHRALYWTNAIFHRAGVLMDLSQQNEETRKMYKMRNLLRRLEAKGQHYQYRETTQEVARKAPKTQVLKP